MVKKKLIKYYKIFFLGAQQTDNSPDEGWEDFTEPNYVLSTMPVPYVDNTVMPMFKEWYETEEAAIADLEKILSISDEQWVVLPVYKMVRDWFPEESK